MVLLYNFFILILNAFFRLAAFYNPKAKAWVAGQKELFPSFQQKRNPERPLIWIHSASTGEFEQAKPVIEGIRKLYPGYEILATFFSPSGYEAAKNYAGIDFRLYLPLDTANNARRFFNLAQPSLVILSKYDFWHHHLKTIEKAGVPLLLISAAFRPGQSFFKWYGGFQRAMLRRFTHIFVQDEKSRQLLQLHGLNQCSISGDTRFDRVAAIRQHFSEIPTAGTYTERKEVLVAGSTWPGDETLLQQLQGRIKMIIAPHEITPQHISALQSAFPNHVLFSTADKTGQNITDKDVLIINNIGMLSRLYHYGTITYIGGGFTRDGIHNTLEAAVWGKPVIFGPNYKKYREAHELIAAGGAFSVKTAAELEQVCMHLLQNKAALKAASDAAEKYIQDNSGATDKILRFIQENRLLTRL